MRKKLLIILCTFLFICFTSTRVHAQEPTTSEVYDALLESKETLIQLQNEKINFLNNTISWIIAIATIASTVIISVISYIYRNLLKNIRKRNEQLKQQEEVIAKIVQADEFQEKLDQLQNDLAGLQNKQQKFQKKIGDSNNIRW